MPWITRAFHEWQVLTFTLLTAALAFALMPLFSSLLPLMAVMFLLGLGLGAAQPNTMSLLHARAPAGRVGEALGLRVTIINGSSVVLPLIFGAFGAVVGASLVFWIMALVLGTGGVLAARRHAGTQSRRIN
jgi:MFS family permease